MKLRVLIDADGRVLGIQQGPAAQSVETTAELVVGPGQTLHEIDTPDSLAGITDLEELHRQVKATLRTKLRVLVDADGRVLGVQRGPAAQSVETTAELVVGPGQTLHEIDTPDSLVGITDLEELHRQVKARLAKP